jgi:hypothetical protein
MLALDGERAPRVSVARRIVANKGRLTIVATAILVAIILLDALANSKRVLRFACGLVSEEWQETLPCPGGQRVESDPRKTLLTEMGVAWDEENFWKAVRRGDERAVTLFLKGGMTISSAGLHQVLIERTATRKASLDWLLALASTRNAEFCSWDDADGAPVAADRSVLRFAQYAKDEKALSFVKRFCPNLKVGDALSIRLAGSSKRLQEAASFNERNRKALASCEAALLARQYGCAPNHPDRSLCSALTEFFFERVCPKGTQDCINPSRYMVTRKEATGFCASRFPLRQEQRDEVAELTAAVQAFNN